MSDPTRPIQVQGPPTYAAHGGYQPLGAAWPGPAGSQYPGPPSPPPAPRRGPGAGARLGSLLLALVLLLPLTLVAAGLVGYAWSLFLVTMSRPPQTVATFAGGLLLAVVAAVLWGLLGRLSGVGATVCGLLVLGLSIVVFVDPALVARVVGAVPSTVGRALYFVLNVGFLAMLGSMLLGCGLSAAWARGSALRGR